MSEIIDRRPDSSKGITNRTKLKERLSESIKKAVGDLSGKREIVDITTGGTITVSTKGIGEPYFHVGKEHNDSFVLPGNKDFIPGDSISKPSEGGGGRGASADGEGEDEFVFQLSREEFLHYFLADLELPNLERKKIVQVEHKENIKAGFNTTGPANLSVTRTVITSMSRRIALNRPKQEDIELLEKELECEISPEEVDSLQLKLKIMRERQQSIPYFEKLDLRFRNIVQINKPAMSAVMICLMDVSASMDEEKKDIAKRFFILLYLFLTNKYKNVKIRFIRHTHEAKEVDENTFFYHAETGGTMVSPALKEAREIIARDYPPDSFNVYAAHASDGDNIPTDTSDTEKEIRLLLPMLQYFMYLEVPHNNSVHSMYMGSSADTILWTTYSEALKSQGGGMAKVSDRKQVYNVLRGLFGRKEVA